MKQKPAPKSENILCLICKLIGDAEKVKKWIERSLQLDMRVPCYASSKAMSIMNSFVNANSSTMAMLQLARLLELEESSAYTTVSILHAILPVDGTFHSGRGL